MSDYEKEVPAKRMLLPVNAFTGLIKGDASLTPVPGTVPAYSASGQDVWVPRTLARAHGPGIVLSAVGARCGRVFFADHECWGTVANTASWRISPTWDPAFVHYVLGREGFWIRGGSAQPYVQVGPSLAQPVALIPLRKQRQIVHFLDQETRQINRLISKQERLIELLAEKREAAITQAVTEGLDPSAPTKPSGTPWQGPVPANWSVQPLKNLVRIQTGVTLGKDYSEAQTESFAYLRVANVQVGRVDLTDVKRIDLPADQAAASLLQKGDVLMTEGGDRDKLARGCIWDAPIAPCVHQNHIFAARTKSTLLNEFLVLVLDAAPARTYFFLTGKQSTNLASTNSTTVKNFRFGLPPLDEQRLIVQEVRSKTEKIDSLTAKARAVISVLQERRSALISAAVTGKIDVREGAA